MSSLLTDALKDVRDVCKPGSQITIEATDHDIRVDFVGDELSCAWLIAIILRKFAAITNKDQTELTLALNHLALSIKHMHEERGGQDGGS